MVLVNGFPKSGTHAIKKGVELLGLEVKAHLHEPHPYSVSSRDRHVCIFRNPRNCLVSMCRFKGMPLVTGSLIRLLRDYDGHGPMAAYYESFLPWREDPGCLCVTYEDLCASDAALRRIAEYLDTPYFEDAWPSLPGLTLTWTGVPSNWREHWSQSIQSAWASSGMVEVEQKAGYVNG
jgi:hypothetical protein